MQMNNIRQATNVTLSTRCEEADARVWEPHAVSADGEGGERGGAQQVAAVGAVQGQPLQARGRLYAAAQAGAGRGAQLQAGQVHQ